MSATGPLAMEGIILNRKAGCTWKRIYWFSRMEGNSVLSLEKLNEQVEISLWGKRSKRVGDGPFAD